MLQKLAVKFIMKMKNFLINAVQRLIPRMSLDEGRGCGRRTGRRNKFFIVLKRIALLIVTETVDFGVCQK